MAEQISSEVLQNLDVMFLIVTGMFVFFMQCGFAFLEAGAVRSKNATNILIKNVMDSFVSGVSYWLFGYAFAYGDGSSANKFIGFKHFASHEMESETFASWFFQYTFAATAATIVSGAVAERCEFIAYFTYSIFITGFIYPVVTHWAWGGGWLSQGMDYSALNGTVVNYQDFAGSGVVHVLGGVAALVGAILLGPRLGRFHKESGTIGQLRGHSVPIAALGGFILFFGFLAFNGGSQLSITNKGDGAAVALSVVNTIISASFAAFGSLIINRLNFLGSSWSLLATINGALTGMVAACAGCNAMAPWGACILGIISSIVYTSVSYLLKKLRIDDPLDAVAVHLGGGTWGVIAIAFLDKEEGIFVAGDLKSGYKLAWQLIGWSSIVGWSAVLSLIIFGLLKLCKVLRVPAEIEEKGLDIPKHKEPAYPVEAYGHGHIEKLIQILENHPREIEFSYTNMTFNKDEPTNAYFETPEVKRHRDKMMENGTDVTTVKLQVTDEMDNKQTEMNSRM
ncbi:hypothetical protein FSP39_003194 [Pinctada imbricata]|uniref:Ammonium transporter n=1 Tax=Pinctada imbricata TaxID=66713 RepID=A0AA89C6B3_PINIB|nr:hypothetical protein FSP39_003194 [Pinctada imbricata]